MNRDRLAGKWHQFVGEVKVQWGSLTRDEATVSDGKAQRLKGFLLEWQGDERDRLHRSPGLRGSMFGG